MKKNKDKKITVRVFTVADWQDEQEYLREQHKKGWRYVKSGLRYHFERCEPEDVIYQLDFNPEGAAHKEEYLQMFKDCGWEYINERNGYTYFRKPVSEMNGREEEIFCDDESRLEMAKNVIRTRIFPLLYIFALVIIPQIIGQTAQWYAGNVFAKWLLIAFIVLFVLYIAIFIRFIRSYFRFKNRMKK